MRFYDEIAQFEREGFTVVVEKTWEDIDPGGELSDCFASKQELYNKIDLGELEWFVLRVRVMLDDHILATEYLGGCLYDRDKIADVLTDGIVEDMLYRALPDAREKALRHANKLLNVLAV